ncbi:MAG: hypothetical protein GWO81_03210 [Verrucomicrobia bacterium]|nr:hypothetical protein [Verrucomicrobiota bacterium]
MKMYPILTLCVSLFTSVSHAVIDIYLENIAFANDAYNFYTDYNKTTELNFFEGTDALNVNQTYRFTRLPTGTGHPSAISDSGSGTASADIGLSATTAYLNDSQGGTGDSFILSFNSGFDYTTDTLTYYCSVHPSSMNATFTVVPEPAAYALAIGTISLGITAYRRRK